MLYFYFAFDNDCYKNIDILLNLYIHLLAEPTILKFRRNVLVFSVRSRWSSLDINQYFGILSKPYYIRPRKNASNNVQFSKVCIQTLENWCLPSLSLSLCVCCGGRRRREDSSTRKFSLKSIGVDDHILRSNKISTS